MNAAAILPLLLVLLPPSVTLGIRLNPVAFVPDATSALGPDPCRCTANESIGVTQATGNCGGSPPQDCYVYEKQRPNGSTALSNGNCYYPPACPSSATTCHFQGWEVRFRLAGVNCAGACCYNPANHCVDIQRDGVNSGSVCAGGTSSWFDLTEGNQGCNSGQKTHVASLVCPPTGAVVYQVTATYSCTDCTTPH